MPEVPLGGAGELRPGHDWADKEAGSCQPVVLQNPGQPAGFPGKAFQW